MSQPHHHPFKLVVLNHRDAAPTALSGAREAPLLQSVFARSPRPFHNTNNMPAPSTQIPPARVQESIEDFLVQYGEVVGLTLELVNQHDRTDMAGQYCEVFVRFDEFRKRIQLRFSGDAGPSVVHLSASSCEAMYMLLARYCVAPQELIDLYLGQRAKLQASS